MAPVPRSSLTRDSRPTYDLSPCLIKQGALHVCRRYTSLEESQNNGSVLGHGDTQP